MLDTQRETLSGSTTETLDIVVYANGQKAPVETLSGGERFRADLALRLAVGRMLSRRSGTKLEMLAVDEGFGSQDNAGQQAVVSAISSLVPIFDLILVISHVRSVADALGALGKTIEIGKSGGKSIVEVK
jgi:exonuclease SbcC